MVYVNIDRVRGGFYEKTFYSFFDIIDNNVFIVLALLYVFA
jgi:hypothetical protein